MAEKVGEGFSLQIRCNTGRVPATFKRDVDDLAKSLGYGKTSYFLYDVLNEYLSLNRDRIEQYRELVGIPLIKPKAVKKEAAVDDSEA